MGVDVSRVTVDHYADEEILSSSCFRPYCLSWSWHCPVPESNLRASCSEIVLWLLLSSSASRSSCTPMKSDIHSDGFDSYYISHPCPSHLHHSYPGSLFIWLSAQISKPSPSPSLTHLTVSHYIYTHLSYAYSFTSLTHVPHISHSSALNISHPSPSHLSSISLSYSSPCRFWTLSASFTV